MSHLGDTLAAGPTGTDAGELERLRASNAELRARLAEAERRLAAHEGPPGEATDMSPGGLDALWSAIEDRFGLTPSFFRLASDAPAVAWNLWRQAEFAYLDSPLPSLFKERLFTYLSRYCDAPYCVSRHCAFLLGHGNPAGDPAAEATAPEDVLALLAEPAPSSRTLAEHLDLLARTAPGVDWPEPETPLERAFFGCATAVFLTPHQHARCLRALRRVLGPERYHELMLFLAFVRTAHFWTEVHPELELEADAEALLEEHQALARWIRDAPGTTRSELRSLLQQEHEDLETTRRQLEALMETRERLRKSEEQLSFALQVADLGRWDLDLEQGTAFRSHRHDQIFGYEEPLPEWTYEVFLEHVLEEDRADVDAAFRAATAQGTAWDFKCRIRRADGAVRWIWARGRVWNNDGGHPRRMLGVVSDITEVRTMELALRSSEERFRRAVTHAPVPILLHAEDGHILQVSRAFTDITGYTLGDVPTIADWTERAYGERQEQVQAAIDRLYSLDRRVDEGEYVVRTAGGEERVWAFSSAPLGRDADGRRLAISVAADVTERKRAEEALQESEAKLRRLFDQAPAFIAIHEGPDHVYVFSNDLHDEAVGRRPLIGRPLREAMPELEGQGVFERFDRVYATGEPVAAPEFRAVLERDGKPVEGYFSQVLQPWYGPDGAVAGVMSFAFDVTEQRQAHEALQQERALLEVILETLPAGLVIADADGRITRDNPAAREIWGVPLSASSWKDYSNFVAWWPETGERIRAEEWAMTRALMHGEETRDELIHNQRFDNAERGYYLNNVVPIRNAEGRIAGGVAAMIDVTDRVGAEEALRDLNERLQLALDAARMGTWTFDPETDKATIDERERALFGFDPDQAELQGAEVFGRIHPSDRDRTRAAVAAAVEGESDYEAEFRINHPERGLRWIAARGRLVRDGDGRQLLGVNFDITALKRAEEEVRQMSVRLVHASERERQHIARELHDELGGMLTSLQMSLRMNPATEPAAREELAESQTLAKAMLEKVRQLSLDLRPSLLDDLGLGPALDQLGQRFEARTRIEVDLHCEVPSGHRLSPEVETTAYRIAQAALTNVARHADADRAQVLCHHEADRLVLHVIDEGRGFDPDGLDDGERSTGLAIMHERASMVGGRCEIVSQPGAGTRVTATLPVEAPPAAPDG